MNQENPIPKRAERRGCFAGCLSGCLVVLIIFAILAAVAAWFLKNQFNTFMARYESLGYHRVSADVIEVNERLTEPTIFVGRVVKIKKGSDRGIGMVCLSGEIDGKVVGNVHFTGLDLTIDKDAELMEDLDVKALTVNAYGVINGKITGIYQTLNKKPPELPKK